MKKIVLASNNKHKIAEFKKILVGYEIVSMGEVGFYEDIVEDGNTFLDNSLIKAKTIHNYLKENNLDYIVIADDSGLCCTGLGGEPGVMSARYSGEHGNDQANRDKLLKNLAGKNRDAYFLCMIVVYYPNGEYKYFDGKTDGYITEQEIGKKDFGYDCIFYSNDLDKTFGEASEEEKNRVSHRGRAIDKMLNEL